jgi:quercetin dioxygenase-like cupin family protein
MRVIEFSRRLGRTIDVFDSAGASSVALGDGSGEAHVYAVHFEPGGEIGAHETGFAQLFLVVEGEGWVAGADGRRTRLRAGQGAYFERGELHAKGGITATTAIMVQVAELVPRAGDG